METIQYMKRRKSGKYWFSEKPILNGTRFYARWREITVSRWKKIADRSFDKPQSPPEMERKLWEYLLIDSNLLDGIRGRQKHDEEGKLLPEAMDLILKFVPSRLPHTLLTPILRSVRIEPRDMEIIKFQCQQLWLGKGTKISNPHPLLEEAVSAMVLKERYGMPSFNTIGDMPYKLYVAFRVISGYYSDIQEMNMQTRDLGEKAKRLAGLTPGPYEDDGGSGPE